MPFTEYSRLITINEIDDLKKDLKTKGKSVKICGMFLWLLQNKYLLFCTALTANSKQWFTTYFLREAGAGRRCSECALTGHNERREEGGGREEGAGERVWKVGEGERREGGKLQARHPERRSECGREREEGRRERGREKKRERVGREVARLGERGGGLDRGVVHESG